MEQYREWRRQQQKLERDKQMLMNPSRQFTTEVRLGRTEGALKRSQSTDRNFQKWLPDPTAPRTESVMRGFYPGVHRYHHDPHAALARSFSGPNLGTPATMERGDPVVLHKMRRQFATMVQVDPRVVMMATEPEDTGAKHLHEDMSEEGREHARHARAFGHGYMLKFNHYPQPRPWWTDEHYRRSPASETALPTGMTPASSYGSFE